MPARSLPQQVDHIAGERVAPTLVLDGDALCDPSTGAVLQPRRATDPVMIDKAITTAQRVHREGSWAGTTIDERADWLTRIADELDRIGEAVAVAEGFGSCLPISVARVLGGSLGGSFRGAAAQLQTGWESSLVHRPGRPVGLRRLP